MHTKYVVDDAVVRANHTKGAATKVAIADTSR
jgi:hypothetical protein